MAASDKDRPKGDKKRGSSRDRILSAAARLLAEGGRDALTTRAVAAAACVQSPTLYRLFSDKSGLLSAVAERDFTAYVTTKNAQAPLDDPLDDLRAGWDLHVAFGLAHPAIFSIIYCAPGENRSAANDAGQEHLARRVSRIAAAGLLAVEERRAVEMVHAAGVGLIFALLATRADQRDPGLSKAMRETVIAAITSAAPVARTPGPAGAAVALRASLDQGQALSPGERHLLGELLDRLAREPDAGR